ncbi:hypothetical protein SB2_28030 [Methylobacterium radiotolerans]|nr:hypothetical protein SB3_29525 [Methylobacterium radiotolerans]KTS43407.1 hypothetical protein SB2_28030 [Methylobacterium radiotolerans]
MPEIWSRDLIPSSEDWSLRGGTRSGGQTFEGNEAVIGSPTARWKAALAIPCMTPATIFAMRRLIALGRSTTWLVGPYEQPRAPWVQQPVLGGIIGDRTLSTRQPALSFRLAEGAQVNATSLKILRLRGGALAPGMILSIGGRLHVVTQITTDDPLDPSTNLPAQNIVGINIRPWLREAQDTNTVVEFARPVGTMRLASDDTGALELQLSRHGIANVDLIEAF